MSMREYPGPIGPVGGVGMVGRRLTHVQLISGRLTLTAHARSLRSGGWSVHRILMSWL